MSRFVCQLLLGLLLSILAASMTPAQTGVVENALPKIASGDSLKPSINGTRVTGTTPGKPFIFMIPATGEGPLTFTAKGLPSGLTLDSKTGIITGSVKKAGSYVVSITVKGARGQASRKLKIEAGDHKLALTPPMGWNSWNCWAGAIDDAKVRAAADAMIKSGLAAHGYQYINIDDCWEEKRGDDGEIITNARFPDMKALADYVHSKGLKLGIYSSPGPKTCAGFTGSYKFEEQDAKTYAKWGIDYLKYDCCSYGEIVRPKEPEDFKKPYRIMDKALDSCGRDILFSLCQYGMGKVWEWGEEVGGNCWRTTGDINDSWGSMSGIGFSQNGHEKFAGPGHWNDPDMLVVGMVGWSANLHPSRLSYIEQVTHISLWSLLSSPMLIGCDMTRLDQFTTDLLTNDEVIAISQDPLGKPAGRISDNQGIQIWSRPLSDGTIAVGLFNTSQQDAEAAAKWSELGIEGKKPVRDLWLKKDLGDFSDQYTAKIPSHGAVLIKIGKPTVTD
ncbi:MAG: putative Ig domain-containing protein [Armatimonadetes bacterium]|nr:putative Ig domain-containing protein [Armatimonadota bacterium]